MAKIRKVVITEYGDVGVLKVADATCPPPPKGHVQIATLYSGFSGADVNMRKGIYPFMKKAPLTPGYCLVGRVTALGDECSIFNPGDIVAVLTKYDAEAELVNQPEKYCVRVKDGVDLQQAAALPCDWVTAYNMVTKYAKVARGQKVFVHGLSGAVGFAIMKISQLQGAEVYGTASQRNHAILVEHGAHPFVYTDKKWIAQMQGLGGAHAVFDPLGYESFDESYSILSPKGILVAYGNNKDSIADEGHLRSPMFALTKMLARNLNPITGKRTTFFGLNRDSSYYHPSLTTLLDMLAAGTITVPIKNVWDLEEIQTAHREWGSGTGVGSLLIKVAKD
ncbi:GroES-like protein [Apiospora marii]|uniref:GroES-like protein n=1 Tax=Apiospora marii TaxID=335849 RepID=A0ABR1RK06_9PEZI